MAQRTVTTLIDDVDGSEATKTISFAWDGKSYEIDLNDKNASAFEGALKPYLDAARRTQSFGARQRGGSGRRGSSNSDGPSATDLREWAKANGYQVSERGRISAEVKQAYDAAH